MNTPRKQKGFTIIETLVAITVLMIAVAGPLVVASKGLFGALASKDQMTASYLAQESMEVIKNMRDNNVNNITQGNSGNWLDGLGNCISSASANNYCDASAIDGQSILSLSGPIQLTNNNGYYSHSGTSKSIFYRYFTMTGANCGPDQSGQTQGSDDECLVTVTVKWNEGTTPYEVDLSSEITDSTR
ncbi:MAG: prepilin-type N-terminal cleavage/methylation domain-containing protein [Patescibacteria group bacterium]|nr:prepilin-type N-terminal cleavage/methylation domain-containing protein [Patescibacteria group bacterium]